MKRKESTKVCNHLQADNNRLGGCYGDNLTTIKSKEDQELTWASGGNKGEGSATTKVVCGAEPPVVAATPSPVATFGEEAVAAGTTKSFFAPVDSRAPSVQEIGRASCRERVCR